MALRGDRVRILVIGAGPAGLAAAQAASEAGVDVIVTERKRSPGRKFLVAGKSGLNLTNAAPIDEFIRCYGESAPFLEPHLRAHPPEALRALAESLTGGKTWAGTSGRVFTPQSKAAPMLREWIGKLKASGVRFRMQRTLSALEPGEAVFEGGAREAADAIVLALGGASWPETGSDGAWTALLLAHGVDVAALAPSNAGVEIEWPAEFLAHEGKPLKNVALSCAGVSARGDAVVTRYGLEGTPVYRLNAAIRAEHAKHGAADLRLDLLPDLEADVLARRLGADELRKASLATRLKRAAKLPPIALALLRTRPRVPGETHAELAARLKAIRLVALGLRPIAEAISSAGGVRWHEIDSRLMLSKMPGVFVAGEMVDWDAPTGGYLLQACWSTGRAAGGFAASHALAGAR